jgi:hypothetical protein
VVCNHGNRRWAATGFAHCHANARKSQAPKANRQAAHRCHGAPCSAAIGHKITPIGSISKAAKWHGQGAVKQGECQAAQKSHGRIGNLKLLLDGLHENAHDLTIDEAHGVDKQEQS